ncbi:hypothetical protein DPMN_046329 [Dreissena polymorpha]|uniref:Uncharacterized protein n=1 Tax=Dreissena polymorpha TaxID=45954 RepID=A0A9D4I0G4_DREPO|nr:hypothetical protein DPMN_046329 [Dreissena polymorpha]
MVNNAEKYAAEDAKKKKMQEGAITASVGTQTEVYIIPEENLQILAQKKSRGKDVNADRLDRTLFANLRQLLGNEPFNTKLADLMGYQPRIYPTISIRRKISKKPGRIESIRKDIEAFFPY